MTSDGGDAGAVDERLRIEHTVLAALSTVKDPEFGAGIVDYGLVRIAEGRHRAYMSTFFSDPNSGACSVGVPPANLGLRLVREAGGLAQWLGF